MRKPLKIVLPWEPCAITVIGDPHLEEPSHARARFLSDMQRASDAGDIIWIMGDIWSAILAGDMKRSTGAHRNAKLNAEDESTVDDYVNDMIEGTAELLKPFANNIEVIMVGNHETAVLKHHQNDMVRGLIRELNHHKTRGVFESARIQHGGYMCWLQLLFVYTSGDPPKRTGSVSQKGYFHHGGGGAAPVTKGMIDGARIKAGNWFDFGVVGHKHTQVFDRDRVSYMDDYGNIKTKDRDFAIVGGYSGERSSDYDPMSGGYRLDWSEEKFYHNEAQGCIRLTFRPTMHNAQCICRRGVEIPESWEN